MMTRTYPALRAIGRAPCGPKRHGGQGGCQSGNVCNERTVGDHRQRGGGDRKDSRLDDAAGKRPLEVCSTPHPRAIPIARARAKTVLAVGHVSGARIAVLRRTMSTWECIACDRTIEPGEPMVVVITAMPTQLSRVSLLRHVDAAPGRWHWRCAPPPGPPLRAATDVSFAKVSSHSFDDGTCSGDRPRHAQGESEATQVTASGRDPGPPEKEMTPRWAGSGLTRGSPERGERVELRQAARRM